MTILEQIAQYTRQRVAQSKQHCSRATIRRQAENLPKGTFAFTKALEKEGLSFICECKKASPSKGVIAQEYPYQAIAQSYVQAGADAISVLTEPKWFQGADAHLEAIAKEAPVPCLRKDFTIDPYMIYEAKRLGASAVLLIVALLEQAELTEYQAICTELGLSALVEVHDEGEIETALRAGASIIGVNNRNLHTFAVDIQNSGRLRKLVPEGVLFVAESGVQTISDVQAVRHMGADAVLIGEMLMKASDKQATLQALRGCV